MRFRRVLFVGKCFLFGAFLRALLFGLVTFRSRSFFESPVLAADRSRVGAIRYNANKRWPSYTEADFSERRESQADEAGSRKSMEQISSYDECSMSTCFNFSRCRGRPFKVHIYPTSDLESLLTSASDSSSTNAYIKILSSIIRSGVYTSDPSQACLFVVAFDTLDRDLLSADYVKNLHSRFVSLPPSLWNNGENHLIFNLYPGTWPDYDVTDLGIETGKAILVKASFSIRHFRPNFDVSLPLFHRVLPLRTVDEDDDLFRPVVSSTIYGSDVKRRRYLFSFKGKRYVHGIGSETRNSLYHLHDGGRESVVVTTCRHGKNWRQVKDERCDEDNDSYDHWGSYEWLLSHSDFCLLPRGRRLGSYRFLESLQYGCVPMILSNEWELPFSEIVTWSEASVMADERILSMVPDILHEIKTARAFTLRQNAKRLSQMYFSSVDRIVSTILEVIKRRLQPWMPSPLDKEHFESSIQPSESSSFFHAFISLASKRNPVAAKRLLEAIVASSFCAEITVLCFDCAIAKADWSVPVTLVRISAKENWPLLPLVRGGKDKSDAIFWIDASESIIPFSTDEIDFAMQVWRFFPDRLVGFFARRHHSDGRLSSKLLNDFTFLTSSAVLYHKSHNKRLNSKLLSLPLEKRLSCFDRLLNQLSTENGKTPIKLTARYQSGKAIQNSVPGEDCFGSEWNSTELAIKASKVRFDPILYKDPVSNLRKKYRQMEFPSAN